MQGFSLLDRLQTHFSSERFLLDGDEPELFDEFGRVVYHFLNANGDRPIHPKVLRLSYIFSFRNPAFPHLHNYTIAQFHNPSPARHLRRRRAVWRRVSSALLLGAECGDEGESEKHGKRRTRDARNKRMYSRNPQSVDENRPRGERNRRAENAKPCQEVNHAACKLYQNIRRHGQRGNYEIVEL